MIVQFEELHRYRGEVAMVDGAFDPLHYGHIRYFAEAAKLGSPVLCNLAPDTYVSAKHAPLLPAEQRSEVIDALRHIDYTHLNAYDTEAVLEELRPKYYVKGSDWKSKLPPAQVQICANHGTEIVYLDTVLDSSTKLLASWLDERSDASSLARFERYAQDQARIGAAHYDAEYFTTDWRDDGNCYTIDARREIEGKNPALIKEIFEPQRVLDLGCGPGSLMFLLQEQGIVADGVDFSPGCVKLAPQEVRERIITAPVTAPPVPDNAYDLVICREVFEHLTILEVQQAVEQIARVTSKFVYLTTRFHPEPRDLLDVTTQFDVDPTHITLLNQDFLRLLFVMQGLRRRKDLEQRMDWLNKGRVLVYEKEA